MSEERYFEVEIRVRSATDEIVKHLEGPLWHQAARDVAADLEEMLRCRSANKMRTIDGTDR